MRRANAEEIAAAKAEAQKAFGISKLVAIPFKHPIDVEVLAVPFDRAGWHRHYDLSHTRPDDVAEIVWVERVKWPPDAAAIREKWGGAPGELARVLKRHAGETAKPPRLEELTPAGAPAIGLSPEAAQKILDAAEGVAWLVLPPRSFGGRPLGFVLETPDPTRFDEAIDQRDQAIKECRGILDGGLSIILEAYRWPQAMETLLGEWPGITEDLVIAYAQAGGVGLAGEAKSV